MVVIVVLLFCYTLYKETLNQSYSSSCFISYTIDVWSGICWPARVFSFKEVIMKVGITERGDAALDLSWVNKMHSVQGAVLITKQCCNEDFLRAVRRWKNKVIVHCTITGYGGGVIEPHVPSHYDTMEGLHELASFMGPGRVVLRIDPIIPNDIGRTWIPYLINQLPESVKRVRFSIIDNYKHLALRGLKLPWNTFHAPEQLVAGVVQDFMPFAKTHSIECCGESYAVIPEHWKRGCISDWDLILLGLDVMRAPPFQAAQRKSCNCLSVKTELLSRRNQCPHGCLYCYWR